MAKIKVLPIMVALLGFLLISHCSREWSGDDDGDNNMISWDVTVLVNSVIMSGNSSCRETLQRIVDSAGFQSILVYTLGAPFRRALFRDQFRNQLAKLLTPLAASEKFPPPKIFISFRPEDIDYLPMFAEAGSTSQNPNGTFHFILNISDVESCTNLLTLLGTVRRARNATGVQKIGLQYSTFISGQCSRIHNVLIYSYISTFILDTGVGFNIQFPVSFGLFEDFMMRSERYTRPRPRSGLDGRLFNPLLLKFKPVFYFERHPRDEVALMHEAPEVKRAILENIQLTWYYATRWARSTENPILVERLQCHGDDGTLKKGETTNPYNLDHASGAVLPYLQIGGIQDFECEHFLPSILPTLNSTFGRSIAMELGSSALNCLQQAKFCQNGNRLFPLENPILLVPSSKVSKDELVNILKACELPLSTVFLNSYWDDLLAALPQISVGCWLHFGPLKGINSTTELINHTKKSCPGIISSILWQFQLSHEEIHERRYSYFYYMDNIQKKLELVNSARRSLAQKSVILRLEFEPSSTGTGEFGEYYKNVFPNVFCDRYTILLNQYYEGIVNWAALQDVTVILKHAWGFGFSDSSSGKVTGQLGWFLPLATRPRIPNQTEIMFVMRNYPEDMSSSFPVEPCIHRSTGQDVTRDGIQFDKTLQSISVNMGIRNESMTRRELQNLLHHSLHEFSRVEVLLGRSAEKDLETLGNSLSTEFLSQMIGTLSIGNSSVSSTLSIQIPLQQALERSVLEVVTRLGVQLDDNKVNQGALKISGIHVSSWEQSDLNSLAHILEEWGFQFDIGLVLDNCLTLLSTARSEVVMSVISKVNYLICNESSIGKAYNLDYRGYVTEYLDNHLALKRLMAKEFRKVDLLFRLHTSPPSGKVYEIPEKLLTYWRDIVSFSKAYNVNYVLFPTVDDPEVGESGWWGVENYTDMANPFVYSDKLSAFLNLDPWRPPAPPPETPEEERSSKLLPVMIGITSSIALSFIFFSGFLLVRQRRSKEFLTDKEEREFLEGCETRTGNSDDVYLGLGFNSEYSLDKAQFNLESSSILGMGNFGAVYKALVAGSQAAVKMPHDGCSRDSFRSMLCEVKVLSYVGHHPNVIRFIGAYTKELRAGVLYIATELCENGSVITYLREKEKERGKSGGDDELSRGNIQELAQFSYEIACGMEYISEKKVVHADLSARNVLLDQNMCCKIGDFGLSRKLYDYGKYVKQSQEPLPWKWMAYEVLHKQEFTVKSDVWSYGVLLWEIFSLGGIPYPGLAWSTDFVNDLRNGLRLSKPEFATEITYKEMQKCWELEPSARPTFVELKNHFLQIRNSEYSLP